VPFFFWEEISCLDKYINWVFVFVYCNHIQDSLVQLYLIPKIPSLLNSSDISITFGKHLEFYHPQNVIYDTCFQFISFLSLKQFQESTVIKVILYVHSFKELGSVSIPCYWEESTMLASTWGISQTLHKKVIQGLYGITLAHDTNKLQM
jgi:hypothetical protein